MFHFFHHNTNEQKCLNSHLPPLKEGQMTKRFEHLHTSLNKTFIFFSSSFCFMDSGRRASFKIVIRRVERPFSGSLDKELEWICSSLGFLEPIDRDKVAASVFKEIVQATEKGKPLTSTALAER